MNCHDLASILDEHDLRRLDGPLQRRIAAHLATCTSCAMDWESFARLQQLPDLPMPTAFADACRAAVARSATSRPVRRMTNRHVMVAGLIAAAAAAAMLVVKTDPPAPATAGDLAQALSGDGAGATPVPIAPSPIAPSVDGQRLTPVPLASFGVGVLPLGNHASDAGGQAAIEGFYDAILRILRNSPDIRLLRVESREAAEGNVDYLLDVAGYTTENGLRGTLRASRLGADPLTVPIAGAFNPSCAAPGAAQTAQCLDGAALAESMLGTLRRVLLPPSLSQQRALVARVGDSTATPEQRVVALRELAFPRASPPGPSPQRLARAAALADPAAIHGAIELAAIANPAQRAEVWRILRGLRDPELLRPLIQSARLDVDASVRGEAVSTLGAGFAGDPQVRTELALVASQDPRPLVRALARRVLSGEEAWRSYIVAALQDDDLPAADRVEPLFHHLNGGSEGLGELFDEATIRSFGAALAEAGDTPLAQRIRTVVFSRAAEIESPAMTDLLLAGFRDGAGLNRMTLLNQLVRRRSDVRVEALLREVSINDPDLQLRQIAERALAQGAQSAGD